MLPISTCVQAACILEVLAQKPGNVHRFRDFEDASLLDFLLSAAAIAGVLEEGARRGVGPTILEAVRRTRDLTATNTNLGIIMLLTPLAAVPPEQGLRQGIAGVLSRLTVDDARLAYQAIRLARPGGMGKAPDQDVASEPTRTLMEVMALAANRDGVARQYVTGFHDVFTIGVAALTQARDAGLDIEEGIIGCHLQLLAKCPDTLIARKRGREEAEEAARRAGDVLDRGWPGDSGRQALRELDAWLRAVGHERNPGTTADVVTASLFVALREGTMQLPPKTHGWPSVGVE